MNQSQLIRKLKKHYKTIEPSAEFTEFGWDKLNRQIETEETFWQYKRTHKLNRYLPRVYSKDLFRRFSYAVMLLIIVCTSAVGLVAASGNSIPGDPLYPVKRLSENIVTSITRNPEYALNNRTQEIIETIKRKGQTDSELNQVIQNYQAEVAKIKQLKTGEQLLEKQKNRLEKLIQDTPAAKGTLEEIIQPSPKSGQNSPDEKNNPENNIFEDNRNEETPQVRRNENNPSAQNNSAKNNDQSNEQKDENLNKNQDNPGKKKD